VNVTPERKAEQKIAARWGGNVARLMKERKLKGCDLGRVIDPDNAQPSNVAFILTHRRTMPDDAVCCKVAAFLGVSKEALHAGELPDWFRQPKKDLQVKARSAAASAPAPAPTPRPEGDILQDFVLFALKRKLRALDAAGRYALLQEVARLCIKPGGTLEAETTETSEE